MLFRSLLFLLSVSFQISMPRYILGIFPVFLVLARIGESQWSHQMILTVSAVLFGCLFVIYATRWGF